MARRLPPLQAEPHRAERAGLRGVGPQRDHGAADALQRVVMPESAVELADGRARRGDAGVGAHVRVAQLLDSAIEGRRTVGSRTVDDRRIGRHLNPMRPQPINRSVIRHTRRHYHGCPDALR